jgi:hypothetical protein
MEQKDDWESNRFPILTGAACGAIAGAISGAVLWREFWWAGMILGTLTGAFGGFEMETVIEAGCAVVIACVIVAFGGARLVQLSGTVGILLRTFGGTLICLMVGLAFGRLGGALVRRRF